MMKKLTAVMLTAAVLAGCNGDKETQHHTHQSNTADIHDTKSLIKAAKAQSKSIDSYTSEYTNKTSAGSKHSTVDFSLSIDSKDNQKIHLKNNEEDEVFYVYNKKTILKQDGKWVDASTLVGTQMIAQTKPLLYNSQFELIDQLKHADYKQQNGYTLTESFDDYKEYKALFGHTKDNVKVMKGLEKEYPDIKGSIIIRFNKSAQLQTVTNKLTLKNSKTTVKNDAVTTFKDLNHVTVNIPDAVKKAKDITK